MPPSLTDRANAHITCITYSGEKENSRRHGPNQSVHFTYPGKIEEDTETNPEDRISSLPDDVLVHILSLLMDLREATRTSVLSKEWRHLCSNVGNYDFTCSKTLWYSRRPPYRFRDEVDKFVVCVNKGVSSSCASSITRFKVHCELNARHNDDVDAWVNFAMRKSVRELKLNFSGYLGACPMRHVSLGSLWNYAHYPSVSTLVSLSLVGLRIDTDFLESVLLNFTNLEHLCMRKLVCGHSNLKVVGSLLKLRHLEISCCWELGETEISAKHLTSLVYKGSAIDDVKFSYVPLLNDASFGTRYSAHLIKNLRLISGFSSHLLRLRIVPHYKDISQKPIEVPNQFGNLKQLELIVYGYRNNNLLLFTNFIDACPLLHKLKLQRILSRVDPALDLEKWNWKETKDEAGSVAVKHHHCLNLFEMVGFIGAKVDIELILVLARLAIALEKVILDPNQRYDNDKLAMENPLDLIEAGRREANLLRNHLPPKVQMKVL